MKTHTQKVYVLLSPEDTTCRDGNGNVMYPEGYSLSLTTYSWGGATEDVNLTPDGINITVDVPDFSEQDLLHKAIDSLKAKQKNALAEAEKRRVELQQMIDKLLLIEYKPDDYVPKDAASTP